MKQVVFVVAMVLFLASLVPVLGQEEVDFEKAQQAMKIRRAELDVMEREAKLDFQRRQYEIELQRQNKKLAEKPKYAPARGKRGCGGGCKGGKHKKAFMLGWAVTNILLTIWVFQDLRKRKGGSGIWLVVTLLCGLLGALVYAVVRLGDKPEAE